MKKNLFLPYFLAKRLASDAGGRKNSVMVRVATLSVSIGIAVMIVALGVIYGFKNEIADKLTGFGSHVQILHFDNNISYETKPISSEQPFLEEIKAMPEFRHINSFALKAGILKGREAIQGIVLKGVDRDFDPSFFEKNMVEGAIPQFGDSTRTKEVIISQRLSKMMELGVGDKFEVMFVQNPPRRDLFRVGGIFDTNLGEFDEIMVLTDIRNVQRLNNWQRDQISGFEINGNNIKETEQLSDKIFATMQKYADDIEEQLMVVSLRERNPVIFDWLDTHDLNAVIIIVVMLLVAVFNMIAAMLIILLEKTSMIGILKALGMENGALQRMFIMRSSYIILRGMLWGNITGIGLCYLQQFTGLLKLNAEGYFLSEVPVYINWGYVALLNLGSFAVIVTLLALPTMIVSRILPEKSIRFE